MRLTGPARLAADPITQLADPPSSLHAMAHHSLIGSGQVSTPAAQPAALFPGPPFLPALDQLNSQIASYPGVSQHGNGQVIAATATAAAAGGAAGAYDTEGAAVSDPDNNSDILLFLERWQWLSNHWNLGLPRLGSLQSLQHRSASLTAAGIGHAFTANAPSDAQGIDWASFGTSRAQARHSRSILSVGSGHHECRARVSVCMDCAAWALEELGGLPRSRLFETRLSAGLPSSFSGNQSLQACIVSLPIQIY